ncbi:unnamed protein product [Meloidogyne enterolobii]|uniref:Uncharacterized protein n=1 Tax=Meloidogyne enterolobii TaxID=390850 RepID=A0ACB0XUL3_MELEN
MIFTFLVGIILEIFLNLLVSAQLFPGYEPDGTCTMGRCLQTSQICDRNTNNCCKLLIVFERKN